MLCSVITAEFSQSQIIIFFISVVLIIHLSKFLHCDLGRVHTSLRKQLSFFAPGQLSARVAFPAFLRNATRAGSEEGRLFTQAMPTLTRFQTKTELFWSVFKTICVHTYRFRIVFPVHTTTPYPFWKRCYTLSAHAQMNSTLAHFNISAREIGAKLKEHGGVRPPFWILTVEWSVVRSCRHRFQIASFSPSTLQNSVFEWLRFRW